MLQYEQRIAHERLSRLCFIDYDCEMALVVERRDPTSQHPLILAVKFAQAADAEDFGGRVVGSRRSTTSAISRS